MIITQNKLNAVAHIDPDVVIDVAKRDDGYSVEVWRRNQGWSTVAEGYICISAALLCARRGVKWHSGTVLVHSYTDIKEAIDKDIAYT